MTRVPRKVEVAGGVGMATVDCFQVFGYCRLRCNYMAGRKEPVGHNSQGSFAETKIKSVIIDQVLDYNR